LIFIESKIFVISDEFMIDTVLISYYFYFSINMRITL
jgi:hypothetical protein